jgi:hypothetical protein
MADFKKGDIVTVTKIDSLVRDEQGEVVAVGNKISVFFGEEVTILGYTSSRDERIFNFSPEDLKKEKDWKLETKATKLFGRNMFHHLFARKSPFNPKDECQIEGCPDLVFKRGLYNFWGSVYEVDLCEEHYKTKHGVCGEDLNFKKQVKATAAK